MRLNAALLVGAAFGVKRVILGLIVSHTVDIKATIFCYILAFSYPLNHSPDTYLPTCKEHNVNRGDSTVPLVGEW